MIKLDDNNYIIPEYAEWDGNPLSKTAVNIKEFKATSELFATELIKMFDSQYKSIQYSSMRIDCKDIPITKALGKAGYHITEITMQVTGVLPRLKIDNTQFNKYTFERADKNDYKVISDYSVKYFNHGKFHEDPLIKREFADRRNINMVNDITQKYTTYIGRMDQKIIGFMILNKKNTEVELLLGGLNPQYQHLSYSFWNRIFNEYKGDKHIKKFTTNISAANIPVVNLYSRFGFKFSQASYGFRKFR